MRILFLSYYFPPMGGVGVQRALKFVKFLPNFDIYPTVISAEDAHYTSDPNLLKQIPDNYDIIRIRHSTLLNRLTKILRHHRKSYETPKHIEKINHSLPTSDTISNRTVWRDRILRLYASLQFPDDKNAWGRAAYRTALKCYRDNPYDLILSTSPPVISHFIAAKLKRRLNIPWIADYRDLWSDNESYDMPKWRSWADRTIERHLLSQADGIVTVTHGFAESLRKMTPERIPIKVIHNGYDEDDFSELGDLKENTHRFLLLYTGSLYGKRSPIPFLHGMTLFLENHPEFADKLCVRFVGNIGGRFDEPLRAFSDRYPGIIERYPFVPHKEIPQMLCSADALLMILGGENANGVLPAKVFEYMRAHRPILFIGPSNSESSRLIEQSGHGLVSDQHSPTMIAKQLQTIVSSDFRLSAGEDTTKRFERRYLTRKLAQFIEDIHNDK